MSNIALNMDEINQNLIPNSEVIPNSETGYSRTTVEKIKNK